MFVGFINSRIPSNLFKKCKISYTVEKRRFVTKKSMDDIMSDKNSPIKHEYEQFLKSEDLEKYLKSDKVTNNDQKEDNEEIIKFTPGILKGPLTSTKKIQVLAKNVMETISKLKDEHWNEIGLKKVDVSKGVTLNDLIILDKNFENYGFTKGNLYHYSMLNNSKYENLPSNTKSQKILYDEALENLKTRKQKEEKEKIMNENKLKRGQTSAQLSLLIKKGQYPNAIEKFKNLLNLTKSDPELIEIDSINEMIYLYSILNDYSNALKTFELIEKYQFTPTEKSYYSILKSTKDVKKLEYWYAKFLASGLPHSSVVYTILIEVYSQHQNLQMCLKYFEEMRKNCPNPSSYAHVILMFATMGNFDEAFKYAYIMKNDKVDPDSFFNEVMNKVNSKSLKKKVQKVAL